MATVDHVSIAIVKNAHLPATSLVMEVGYRATATMAVHAYDFVVPLRLQPGFEFASVQLHSVSPCLLLRLVVRVLKITRRRVFLPRWGRKRILDLRRYRVQVSEVAQRENVMLGNVFVELITIF